MAEVVLLVVHGDRTGEAERCVRSMCNELRERNPSQRIEGAVLLRYPEELHLSHVLESLAQEGIRQVLLVPWFLFAGPHVLQDIPEIVAEVCTRYPGLHVEQKQPLAMDPIMVQLLESRFQCRT